MSEEDARTVAAAGSEHVQVSARQHNSADTSEQGGSSRSAAASENTPAHTDIAADPTALPPEAASAQPAQGPSAIEGPEPGAAGADGQAARGEESSSESHQAAALQAGPAGSSQQQVKHTGREFTKLQQGVAAALLVVLRKAIRDGHTLRAAKEALLRSAPGMQPVLARLPDEGAQLPSIRELEQCADAVLLDTLCELGDMHSIDEIRPLEFYTTALKEGLIAAHNEKAAKLHGARVINELIILLTSPVGGQVITLAFAYCFPGIMESIYGRADVLDRAAGGGWAILKEEKATIEAAAVRLTHDVQVYKHIAARYGYSFQEYVGNHLKTFKMALALPSVKPLWKAMRMLARATELDAAKVKLTHMSMSLKSHGRGQDILGRALEVLLDRLLDIAVNNPFCSPIVRGIHKAIPGAISAALEQHRWPQQKSSGTMCVEWLEPTLERMLGTLNAYLQDANQFGERELDFRIQYALDTLRDLVQGPGLTNEADDLIHDAFVEFYKTYTKTTEESSDRHSTDEVAGVGPSSEPQEESSPEELAAREAEKVEKKRAKKARQRAARAQAAAPHVRSQAEAKGIGQPAAEHDDDSAPATPADTGNIAPVPASHKSSGSLGTSASAGASTAFIAAESQEDISDLPLADPCPETSDNSEGASSAISKQGRSVQIRASGTAGDRLEAEASASTDLRSSRSLSPARPSTPQPSPSSRRQEQHAAPTLPESGLGPAQAAQAHQAPSEAALEQEGSWEKVRRSRRRQPQQQASDNGVGPRKAPMPGKALPEQAAAAEPPQAHHLPVPWGTQNGLPVPKPQQAARQPSSACPEACADDDECVVCLDNAREVLFLTCGHMCACQGCAEEIMAAGALCPMCRQTVSNTVTVRF